jgi:hypothetical protein
MAGEKEITIDQAIEMINAEIGRIKHVSKAALLEAGLKVMAAAQRRLRASVITGNLRASGYVRTPSEQLRTEPDKLIAGQYSDIPADEIDDLAVEVGFTANYALFAHEAMGGRAPKFLETVVLENRDTIVEIIKQRTGGE